MSFVCQFIIKIDDKNDNLKLNMYYRDIYDISSH